MHSPELFIFVGHSNAGKTTFVEQLLAELTRRGRRVAAIKHAHHAVELDTAGKDSWRYKQAGAEGDGLAITRYRERPRRPRDAVRAGRCVI